MELREWKKVSGRKPVLADVLRTHCQSLKIDFRQTDIKEVRFLDFTKEMLWEKTNIAVGVRYPLVVSIDFKVGMLYVLYEHEGTTFYKEINPNKGEPIHDSIPITLRSRVTGIVSIRTKYQHRLFGEKVQSVAHQIEVFEIKVV